MVTEGEYLAPFTCPHSSYQAAAERSVITVYADGCRTTNGASGPRRFWCGEDEMGKPNGVSVTEGEYLAAWDEALATDVPGACKKCGSEVVWSTCGRADQWVHVVRRMPNGAIVGSKFCGRPSCGIAEIEAAHAEALILNAGDDLYDSAARLNRIHDGLGRLAENFEADHARALELNEFFDMGRAMKAEAAEHAEYLGEVPWSDRVDD